MGNCKYCATPLQQTIVSPEYLEPIGERVFSKSARLTICKVCDFVRDDKELVALADHPALRCRYCETPWPAEERYLVCPTCREPTAGAPLKPLAPVEAEARASTAAFGWFLWDRGTMD